MDTRRRNNVQCFGKGAVTLLFAHGFGCDQGMWRFLTPHFEDRYRIVLFDLAGCGDTARLNDKSDEGPTSPTNSVPAPRCLWATQWAR